MAEWVAGEWDADAGEWTWYMPYVGPTPGPDGSIYFIQNDANWWYEQSRLTRLRLVSIECPGDIDGDGVTYQQDLGILLGAWDTYEGDPNWDGRADLNGDGHIYQEDLGVVLGDWECGM